MTINNKIVGIKFSAHVAYLQWPLSGMQWPLSGTQWPWLDQRQNIGKWNNLKSAIPDGQSTDLTYTTSKSPHSALTSSGISVGTVASWHPLGDSCNMQWCSKTF